MATLTATFSLPRRRKSKPRVGTGRNADIADHVRHSGTSAAVGSCLGKKMPTH